MQQVAPQQEIATAPAASNNADNADNSAVDRYIQLYHLKQNLRLVHRRFLLVMVIYRKSQPSVR